MAELLFRKGLVTQLFDTTSGAIKGFKEGSLNFTTDEPAIYIDVVENGENARKRIGDIKEFANVASLEAYLQNSKGAIPTTGLYYAIAENVLMKWTGTAWQKINLTTAERAALNSAISAAATAASNAAAAASAAQADATQALADAAAANDNANTRVLQTEFDGFKTTNSADIADAKKAGTDAQTTANEAVAAAGNAQKDATQALADAKAADDKAVAANNNANTRVLTSDFNEFKTTNSAAIADAKKAGTDAQTTANEAVTAAGVADEKAEARLLISEFNTFKTNNAAAIADAKKAGTDAAAAASAAQGTADQAVTAAGNAHTAATEAANAASVADGKAVAAQETADAAKAKADNAILKDGSVAMTQNLDLGNKNIVNLAAPTANAHAATKKYVDDVVAGQSTALNTFKDTVILKDGSVAMGNDWSMGNHKITNLATPVANTDAATKKYADDVASAVDAKVTTLNGTVTTLSGTVSTLSGTVTNNYTTLNEAINGINQKWTSSEASVRADFATADEAQTTAITTAYQAYVDSKLQTADAMVFKGVANSASDLLTNKDKIEAGWTYKVGTAFSIGSTKVYPGDLLIANADATADVSYGSTAAIGTSGATWSHVSSGYESKNAAFLTAASASAKTITLDDANAAARGSITFSDQGNVKAVVSNVINETTKIADSTISFKFEWIDFE